jgi:ABC-type xylose transport system permease subunit
MYWKTQLVEFLESLGIESKYLINGFVGGIVWSLYKKLAFTEALRQVIIGCLVAGYLTPLIAHSASFPVEFISALAFVIGMMGMVIIDGIYKFVVNKLRQIREGKKTLMIRGEIEISESE